MPKKTISELILDELAKARLAHPDGATVGALLKQAGRFAEARAAGDTKEEGDRLIKIAVVALRLHKGEEDTSYGEESAA